ncbi:MAG: ABC transporter ATP-binding protein [Acidimicrobiales bacterium]
MSVDDLSITAPIVAPNPHVWRDIRALVRPYRSLLVTAMFFVIVAAAAGVVPALIVRHVVNVNLIPKRTAGLFAAGVIYLAAIGVVALFTFAYSYVAAIVAQRSIATLRVRLFTHLAALPVSYLDNTPVGDTISRATADVETIDTLFTDGITTLVGQLFSLVAVAVAMVLLSPLLSVVSLVVVPPLAIFSRSIQLRVRDAERATRLAIGELNTQLSETVGGSETIRSFHRQSAFVARFRRALRSSLAAQERSVRYGAYFTPITGLLSSLAIAALLWTGTGGLLGDAVHNLGTLTAFVLLFQSFFAPIVALGDQWNSVQGAVAGAERVFSVLQLPVEPRIETASTINSSTGISVRNVHFGYRDGVEILHGVTFDVVPGEQVAVVGRTGSGKTTLLALIVGLYEPLTGDVMTAGVHPRSFEDDERRRVVGVVPQQVQLFSRSLRDNVTLGDPTFSDEAVSESLSLVGLGPLVERLPEGIDTRLAGSGGGEGATLSAGERQLIALARALVAKPQILVLDEATAAIDAQSDASFRAALRQTSWSTHSAVVTVAHRISTAKDADRVIVMEAGRIIEQGPPTELIAAGGRFAALVALDDAGWEWTEVGSPVVFEDPLNIEHPFPTNEENP